MTKTGGLRWLVVLGIAALALGSEVRARADDGDAEAPTTLVVRTDGEGAVRVRGDGVDAKTKPGQALTLPKGAPLLVRVDFAKDDFYEALVELGAGPHELVVPTGKSGVIIAGDERIPVSRGVAITTFAREPRWSLDREGPDGMPTAGPRYLAPGKKGVRLEQVILHATLTNSTEAAFDDLLARSLSTHLIIARDGSVVQPVDLDRAAYHAGERNMRGIGISLVGALDNLVFAPPQVDVTRPPDPLDEDPLVVEQTALRERALASTPNAGVTDPTLRLPLSGPARVNGALVQAYGFSARATRTLEALLLALWRAYPTLGRRVPDAMDALAAPGLSGVLTHWQTDPMRWDPGPGIDLARLGRLAALIASLERR